MLLPPTQNVPTPMTKNQVLKQERLSPRSPDTEGIYRRFISRKAQITKRVGPRTLCT